MKSDTENKLSVLELDVGSGLSECIDISEETLILGVSIDIKEARSDSETSDIKSEADVPNEEISDSAEAMCCQKHRCWLKLVWWCSVSSWSITVRIDGVGILVATEPHHNPEVEFGHAKYGKHLPDIMENAFCCHFSDVCIWGVSW